MQHSEEKDSTTTHYAKLPSTEQVARDLARSPDARIYIDFDYTLFGSNSTEVFINSGRPGFIAALILRFLRGLRPWSWRGGERGEFLWRDAMRIWTILVLLPWTMPLFRRRASDLFRQYRNQPLVDLLDGVDTSRIVIVTNGYQPIVRALLANHRLAAATLVGSSLRRPVAMREKGKLATLDAMGLTPEREKDIVITDSLDDADLLDAVEHGYLSDPVGVDNHNLLSKIYVPFFYSARVKRSPEFVVKQMFLEELPIILLATLLFQPFGLTLWAAGALLMVAYLAAYELGYAENDRIGYLNEARPKLAEDYEQFKDIQLEPAAWYWVVGLTLSGLGLMGADWRSAVLARLHVDGITHSITSLLLLTALWVGVIVVGRMLFHLYNRMPMVWRVFGYILLHFAKYFSLVLLFPAQPAGYALLCAQIVRTWSLYAIRRSGGDMELVASQSIRLGFFLFLLVAFELATPQSTLFAQWQTWALIVFCVVRAAPEAHRKLFNPDVLRVGMRRSHSKDSSDGSIR